MFSLVAKYGNEGHYSTPDSPVGPVNLPVPALIEDEHGQRLLLCRSVIPRQAWLDAVESGAQGLLRVLDGPTGFLSAADFLQVRTENLFVAAYEVSEDAWFLTEPDVFFTMDMNARQARTLILDTGFVHMHTHSEFSPFDGLSTMDEIVQAVLADKQNAVAVTDHGFVAGHPALHKATQDTGVKPIYGMEAYFHPDRFARSGDQYDYWHLCLWALDDQGLQDLWELSTEGFRDGFYGKPRIDWDSLTRLGGHLAASTACLGGPLLDPYQKGDEQTALANLARLGDIFGDRLYIELHTNHLEQQLKANDWIVQVAAKYQVPLLAAVDAHYARAEDKPYHRAWIAMQTSKDEASETDLFGDEPYHLMTAQEVRQQLSDLDVGTVVTEAMANTVRLAERCTAEIRRRKVLPLYSKATPEHPDRFQHDVERMLDQALANWPDRITRKLNGRSEEAYVQQFEYEAGLIIKKKFPGYYLTTADFVTWAKDRGILVGPGRGSGAASLLAYLLRITEIDPIEGDLYFGRFMTEGRDSLPDFDIDFPSKRTGEVIEYVGQRWGADHIARVGSTTRVKNKSAFKDVQRSIASRLPADSFVLATQINKIVDEAESSTAGLGLSWDELFAQVGDLLEPYREKMPELFELAEHFRGRVKTYGKHAAGIIIDPDEPLAGLIPMRWAGEGQPMVTQFDMDTLDYLGQIKYDFLSIRNLDTIQATVDEIERQHGIRISPYDWIEEYDDPEVYDELGAGWTLGVFQLETNLGTRMTKDVKPRNRSELADVTTIGRPGPMRAGLDRLYIKRRSGEEPVTYADPRLEAILNRTWGVMLYQEDVMAICVKLCGYTDDEADSVRRMLGKKKVEEAQAEGRKFVERAIANGTDPKVAQSIWDQMAEFARYSFGRAHAWSYITLAFWTGWLKTHFAREALAMGMTGVKKERIPQFVGEARRLGYQVLPPDINISGVDFTLSGLEIRYGLAAVPYVGAVASGAILEARQPGPFESYDDFIARAKGQKCNIGHVRRLVHVGAFDNLNTNRRALEHRIDDEESGVSTQCVHKDISHINEHGLPCHFDWSSEPIKIGRSGKPLGPNSQPKPPKRCTRACRHYTPRPPIDYSGIVSYTEAEIREIELETLGIYLSSSPFDAIPASVLAETLTADELVTAEFGTYTVVAIVSSIRKDPKGRDFGFITCTTAVGEFSAIMFSRQWAIYSQQLRRNSMILAEVFKQEQDRYRVTSLVVL